MGKQSNEEYQPMDALAMMVENINLGNEVDDLKKRLNKLQHDYLVKCEEVDHWKQFYADLARTVYSAPGADEDSVGSIMNKYHGGPDEVGCDEDGVYYDPQSDYTER